TRRAGLDVVLNQRTGRHTAGVERTHRELRTGLTNRLSGDDAHRQALFDQAVGAHVDAVAPGAHAARGFARQRRADADALQVQRLDLVSDLAGDDLVLSDDDLVGDRVADRVAGRTADDHVLQFDF